MDYFLLIIGSVFIVIGIIGSILPALPGLSLSFLALVLLEMTSRVTLGWPFLIFWFVLVVLMGVLDYLIPAFGTKKFGGSKRGVWGSMIGLIFGIFLFPPFGIIIGPFLGAFIGEISAGKKTNSSIKAAFGSVLGLLTGIVLKTTLAGLMAFYFVKKAIEGFI